MVKHVLMLIIKVGDNIKGLLQNWSIDSLLFADVRNILYINNIIFFSFFSYTKNLILLQLG